mgnify:CR=1 FL=1
MHKNSHSESSGNHAVKIYAQCMNYRIYAKILNSLSTKKSMSGPGESTLIPYLLYLNRRHLQLVQYICTTSRKLVLHAPRATVLVGSF